MFFRSEDISFDDTNIKGYFKIQSYLSKYFLFKFIEIKL